MNNFLITIITPTFNSSPFIRDCIESISRQTYKNIEHLIIDGISTDNTIEIVKSYQKEFRYIKYISEPDNGIYEAMNKGIDWATGEWIYFLGSDDKLFDPDVLQDFIFLLKGEKYDMVYGNVILNSSKAVYDGYFDKKKLITQKNICHQSIFYRRKVFEKFGKYNLEYKIWADWDMNIRLFSFPEIRVKYFDRILAYYNDQVGMSSKIDEKYKELLPAYFVGKILSYEQMLNKIKKNWFLNFFRKVVLIFQ